MKKQKIISVGLDFPGGEVEEYEFNSDQSLLDADIILFKPTFSPFWTSKTFQGKKLYSENDSFEIRESLAHWRRELIAANSAGKLIIIYLVQSEECFIRTGDRETSGTGRNQKITNIVHPINSYDAIPFELSVNNVRGARVKKVKELSYLTQYWKELSSYSPYQATIKGDFDNIFLTTKDGNRIVAADFTRFKGPIILLPPFEYEYEEFVEEDEKGNELWNDQAIKFGKKLIPAVLSIAESVSTISTRTPSPNWLDNEVFYLAEELRLQEEISEKTEAIEKLATEKRVLSESLKKAKSLKSLLFEKGTNLESAIIEALNILGFKATNYSDEESEFDIIFEGKEGRFLGEAEGKDTKALNIDKLAQLERNVQEDFSKDTVTDYAKGVLFGNPQRLEEPKSRTLSFTEKCISGAKRSKTALVLTKDLFFVAKYLKENKNTKFAKACREAIRNTEGEIVKFPKLPVHESKSKIAIKASKEEK